jgi:D-alanine-D-alanine ligase-like ATP-grasp enzyme
VLRRLPPAVRGDGVSSISQLIQAKNRVRADNPHLRDKLFQLDQHRLALLQSKGWKLDDVVPAGEQIVLDPKGNLSTGADSEDISEAVHSTYAKIAERISGAIQGAHVIGVDILSRDHTRPAQADDYIIIEANTGPGLLGHYYPMYGQRRNVFKLVAESCAQRMGERIRAWSAADRPAPSSQSLQPAT